MKIWKIWKISLIWRSPKGRTREAAAMRPRSLQHRPTDTWWPSLKRAEHDLILSTRARARWACIEVESRQTPKNVSDSDSVRIHTSVWPKPPSLWQGSPDSSKQHLEGFCATAGTFLPPTKGSNRGSTWVRYETRLFQPLLSFTKEGRRSMTHSGPWVPGTSGHRRVCPSLADRETVCVSVQSS